jgi:hypothetical protein
MENKVVVKGNIVIGDSFIMDGVLSDAEDAITLVSNQEVYGLGNKEMMQEGDVWIESLREVRVRDIIGYSTDEPTENPQEKINEIINKQKENDK